VEKIKMEGFSKSKKKGSVKEVLEKLNDFLTRFLGSHREVSGKGKKGHARVLEG
jgi:hypothetical protein